METSSQAGTDFTMVGNPTPSNSDFDIVSNTDGWSEVSNGQANSTRVETETSTIRAPTSGPVPQDGPSHALTIKNMNWKEFNEVAGGDVKKIRR